MEVSKRLKKNIRVKIGDYRKRDKKRGIQNTMSLNDCIELIKDIKFCCGCGCRMIFEDYKPWCLYQFTYDKIDNKLGHVKDNIKICCYHCNSTGYGIKKPNCIKLCHIEI